MSGEQALNILQQWQAAPQPKVHFSPAQQFVPPAVYDLLQQRPELNPKPAAELGCFANIVGKVNQYYTLPFQPYDYQAAVINALGDKDAAGLWLEVGAGKAQPLDSKILTPNGWTQMGDIQVGDVVIAHDGTPSKVVGVFPQGEKEIFEVVFSDGAKTECCDDHLWYTQTEKNRMDAYRQGGKGAYSNAPGSVKPLSEIRTTLTKSKGQRSPQLNHKIPLVSGIDLPEKELPIPPYTLGVLLGDGSLKHDAVLFTNPESEVVARLEREVLEGFCGEVVLRKRSTPKRCPSYGVVGTKHHDNPALQALRLLGVHGRNSDEKKIPAEYFAGSFEQRLALLQGLMDTDGYVAKNKAAVVFYSTSEALVDGVIELVNSFGGTASKTCKEKPFYTKNGERVVCKPCWRATIRMPEGVNPFSLPRKANLFKPNQKYKPVRYITEVNPVGRKPAQCIMIDHPDHLYVTDNYIVTHNTVVSAVMALYHRIDNPGHIMVVMPPILLTQWARFFRSIPEINRVLVYRGTPAERRAMNLDADVILLSMDIFKNDFERLYDFYLERNVTLIVDEAVSVKNTDTMNHKCVWAFHNKNLTRYHSTVKRKAETKLKKAGKSTGQNKGIEDIIAAKRKILEMMQ